MRELVVTAFLTLDGVMQAPGGPEEDPSGDFTLGGWSVTYWDATMEKAMDEAMQSPYDLVLGRKTYEIFAAHWPFAGDDPMAHKLNSATKYVASHTLERADWANTKLVAGDIPTEIARLKNGDGPELQVQGSWDLIQTLLTANLVDEFRLWIFPVVVGSGKRLFGDGAMPASLKLVDIKTSTSGVVMASYRPDGELVVGSFAFDEPTDAEIRRREAQAG